MKKITACFALLYFLGCHHLIAQENIPAAEFEKKINTEKPQLLDVRTAGEFQSGHIKNALQADWLKKAEFTDRIQYLDKTKPILVYCASGIRSEAASKWMRENGFTNVQNLKGGISAWKMEGKPIDAPVNAAQLTIEKYTALTNTPGITLVEFGAEWCPPCKQMEPVLKQLQTDLAGKFKLTQVNADIAADVMKAEKINFIPAFIIYKNGKEIWRKQGVAELGELKKKIL
jgi:rhodanese-related sulfurtransferase